MRFCRSRSPALRATGIGCSLLMSSPVTYIAAAPVIGSGMKSCTCCRFQFSFFKNCSTAPISCSVQPGKLEMKYGTKYCSLPASSLSSWNLFEEPLEIPGRLAHPPQHLGMQVLRRHFHVPGHVVLHEFLQVFRRAQRHVHADARLDEHVLHARLRARAAEQVELLRLVNAEVGTDRRPEATGPVATLAGFHVAVLAGVEICCRPAQIRHRAAKRFGLGHPPDFLEHRIHAAAGEEFALVKAQATERATAGATA